MNRSGYSEDYDGGDEPYANALDLYRGAVRSALGGKRGQAFLREMLEALDAMPQKRLTDYYLQRQNGDVCAIGCVGVRRGTKMDDLDPEEADKIAKRFGIAECMVREIESVNDDDFGVFATLTDEQRFEKVRRWVVRNLEKPGCDG